jgi:hypothetical protein
LKKKQKQPTYKNVLHPTESEENKIKKLTENLGTLAPLQLFEKFLDEDFYQHIRLETIRYARNVKNDLNVDVQIEELRSFIGILLLSGYHTVPSEKLYWSTVDDVGVPIVQNIMSSVRILGNVLVKISVNSGIHYSIINSMSQTNFVSIFSDASNHKDIKLFPTLIRYFSTNLGVLYLDGETQLTTERCYKNHLT